MAEQRICRLVQNRDIPMIQNIPYWKIQIQSLEERRIWEKARMRNITQHLSSGGGGRQPQGMDAAIAKLDELEEKHRAKINDYYRYIQQAEQIINSIASEQMRTMVTRLYLDQASDQEVREELKMTRYQFENARRILEDAECMAAVRWHDRYENK